MTDNTRGGSESGTAPLIATDEVTHSGDVADVQLFRPVHVTGAEGSKTVVSITDDGGAMWTRDYWNIPHGVGDDPNSPVLKIGGHATDFEVTGLPPTTGVVEDDRVNAAFSLRGQQAVILTDRAGNFIETNTVAHDAADAGGSLKIGGKANAAAPTDVSANNDRVDAWFLRNGAQVVNLSAAGSLIGGDVTNGLDVDVNRLPALPAGTNNIGDVDVASIAAGDNNIGNVDIVSLPALPAGTNNIGDVDVVSGPMPHNNGTTIETATARYTTTQTSTILGPTNAAGVKMHITSIQIQAGGTVGGEVVVYFGTGAYSRGTNRAIFDGEFAPSATNKPGYAQSPFVPFEAVAGDECRVTTSAALSPLTVTIWYYLV